MPSTNPSMPLARETVIGSFDLYNTRVSQDTNQLVKALTIATIATVVTVVTGIIGAVAGVSGMNFDTPFAHTGFSGFLIVTGLMVGASASTIAFAFWRRWL